MEFLSKMVSDLDSCSRSIKQECPESEADNVDIEYHDLPEDVLPHMTIKDLLADRVKTENDDEVVDSDVELTCDNCQRTYLRRHSLISHLRYECGQTPQLQCTHCPKRFKQRSNLKSHFVALHPNQPWVDTKPPCSTLRRDPSRFHCTTCFRSYLQKNGLKRHLKECGKAPQLKCDRCSFRAKRGYQLKRHILLVHSRKGQKRKTSYWCTTCQTYFPFRDEHCLPSAQLKEGPRHKFMCPDCPKSYHTRDELRRHSVIECGKQLMQTSCLNCMFKEAERQKDKLLVTESVAEKTIKLEPLDVSSSLDLPVRIINTSVPKRSQVLVPDVDSTTDREIRKVQQSPGFKCHSCNAVFKTRNVLKKHSCRRREKYQCALCPVTKTTKPGIELHLRGKHSFSIERYECHRCHKSFNMPEYLKSHLRNICGKEKNIPCTHSNCMYKAKTAANMQSHLKLKHQGNVATQETDKKIKPWPCLICDQSFTTKYALLSHVRFKCGKNPQYHCPNCDRVYRGKKDLNRHVNNECGKPPKFQCPYCAYRAKRRYIITKHVERQHKTEIKI